MYLPSVPVTLQKGARMPTMPRDKKRLNVDIPAQLHRRLKMKAAEEGVSLQQLVIHVLEGLLQQPWSMPQPGISNGRTQ